MKLHVSWIFSHSQDYTSKKTKHQPKLTRDVDESANSDNQTLPHWLMMQITSLNHRQSQLN
ncbi:MAG: hypothetical protein CTY32_06765 [Methylotenera sp.]|nr:MAG: hypothetical protein CTY32_06765 [Methylotenera sp.]